MKILMKLQQFNLQLICNQETWLIILHDRKPPQGGFFMSLTFRWIEYTHIFTRKIKFEYEKTI